VGLQGECRGGAKGFWEGGLVLGEEAAVLVAEPAGGAAAAVEAEVAVEGEEFLLEGGPGGEVGGVDDGVDGGGVVGAERVIVPGEVVGAGEVGTNYVGKCFGNVATPGAAGAEGAAGSAMGAGAAVGRREEGHALTTALMA